MRSSRRSIARAALLPAALGLVLAGEAGCAFQHDAPAPLQPADLQAQWIERSPDDPALRDALGRQGIDVAVWPLPRWNLAALSGLALSVHPEMAVARAELAGAVASGVTLLQRANPGLDLIGEHHSAPNATDSPWTVGLALDVSLTDTLLGQRRRRALAATADAQTQQAVQLAAQTAWQVRRRVRDSRRAVYFAALAASAAEVDRRLHDEERALWQSRLDHGAADANQAALARRHAADAAQAVARADADAAAQRLRLAEALGLAPERAAALVFDSDDLAADDASPAPARLQRAALQDRLDVRAALAAYAAADARLQVELARQYPEIRLRPGYEWDQGDNRWQLGLGIVLPTLDRNAGPIAQARAGRDGAAARFMALQAQAIGELAAAEAALAAAEAADGAARIAQAAADASAARTAAQVEAGSADRLDRLIARLDAATAARGRLDARAAKAAAQAALEDVLQRPLDAMAPDISAAVASRSASR